VGAGGAADLDVPAAAVHGHHPEVLAQRLGAVAGGLIPGAV